MYEGTLKIIKTADGFDFTNPGILKIPVEQVYKGGVSKARNPRMQPGVWYKSSDFENVISLKESWVKDYLVELIQQGKIESTGTTKGKMYRRL